MSKATQLTRGLRRRLMYVENKDGLIYGANARVAWVSFSRIGRTVYYRGREFGRSNGVSGNFMDVSTREEYWISGVKKRGSNAHWAESGIKVLIDADATEEYRNRTTA